MKNNKSIAIYGFGGFGREIACIINSINKIKPTWNIIGFFDDAVKVGTSNKYGQVLGGLNILNSWETPLNIVMAIASPSILYEIISKIDNPNITYPNIIAPDVLFFDRDTFSVGHGNVFCHNCRISCNVMIDDFNLFNGAVSLGHDVKIGSFNMFQPETRISGGTLVGNENFFGVRSLVLQQLKIGDNTRIGAASVVIRNTKDNKTYFGNPARALSF